MGELPCPYYCGFSCVIPSATEEKIECPRCRKMFLYIKQSKSHGTLDPRSQRQEEKRQHINPKRNSRRLSDA